MPELSSSWEYAIVVLDFPNGGNYVVENRLCQFGAMGWELVAVEHNRAYFKRPKR